MSASSNAKVAQAWFQAHQDQDTAAITAIASSKLVVSGPGWKIDDLGDYISNQKNQWSTYSDSEAVVEEVIATKNAVVVRWQDRTVHNNSSGDSIEVYTSGASVLHFDSSGNVESLVVYADGLDLLRQLSGC